MGMNSRFPFPIAVAVRDLAGSVTSKLPASRYWLLYIAKGAWCVAVSALVSEVLFHGFFGPQLVIDLIVCPGCACSLRFGGVM